MSYRTTPRRIAALAALSLTALAACGGDDTTAPDDSVAAPVTSAAADAGGLRPPAPIEFTSASAGGSGGGAAPTAEMAADSRIATDIMVAPTYVADFVVADDLPDLPTTDTGFVYDGSQPTTSEQAAELAALFGVEGEPVRVDEWEPGGWQVGPTDGSAPALFLSDDAQHSWGFSPAWDQPTTDVGCGIAGAAPADPGSTVAPSTVPECPEPEPPTGILSADEAEARADELLAQLGVDPAGMAVEPYADEWSASVSVSDQATGRYWSFGFGAEGALQWANGTIGVPEPVGPYPLIDLDAAIARLRDQQLAIPMPADLARTGAAEPATDTPAIEPELVDPATSTATMVPDVTFPAPEPVTVTLVDVEADFWWAWDTDNNVWLVPAYRFIGDDGGWYVVPAVTDDYLVQVDPPETIVPDTVAPVPPLQTAPSTVVPPTVAPVDEADGADALAGSVGKSLEEFTADAEALGWSVRVVEIDGVSQPVTMDLRTDRLNVAVATEADGSQTVTAIVNVG